MSRALNFIAVLWFMACLALIALAALYPANPGESEVTTKGLLIWLLPPLVLGVLSMAIRKSQHQSPSRSPQKTGPDHGGASRAAGG